MSRFLPRQPCRECGETTRAATRLCSACRPQPARLAPPEKPCVVCGRLTRAKGGRCRSCAAPDKPFKAKQYDEGDIALRGGRWVTERGGIQRWHADTRTA